MTQGYRDALLEYLALGQLLDDLRGQDCSDFREEIYARKCAAKSKIDRILTGHKDRFDH